MSSYVVNKGTRPSRTFSMSSAMIALCSMSFATALGTVRSLYTSFVIMV